MGLVVNSAKTTYIKTSAAEEGKPLITWLLELCFQGIKNFKYLDVIEKIVIY